MKIATCAFAVAALAFAAIGPTTSARADDGKTAAWAAGGFLGGMLLGNSLAKQHQESAPAPADYDAYDPPPRNCHWTRGRPVWDDNYGVWRRPRVQVCD